MSTYTTTRLFIKLVEVPSDQIAIKNSDQIAIKGRSGLDSYLGCGIGVAMVLEKSENRIKIIAGSGVNYTNVEILYEVGIRHFHLSGRGGVKNNGKTDPLSARRRTG